MSVLIDVSNYQGSINWAAAAPAVQGAYIKVTEGSGFVDSFWRANRDGATAHGVPVGAYHFADLGDPVAEANHFADQVLTAQWQLRPVLDVETQGATAGWITAFRRQFRARTGQQQFRVYSSRSFFQGALNPAGWIDANTDIWCAAYGSSVGWTHPQLVLWQSTDAATVPGISGQVDADQPMNGWTPAVDLGGSDVTYQDAYNAIRDYMNNELYTSRADGKTQVKMSDCILDNNGALYRQYPTRVPGSTYTDTLAGYAQNADKYGYLSGQSIAAIQTQLAAIKGALTKEEADLLAAIKAITTGTVDVTALATAIEAALPGDLAKALGQKLAA